MTSDDAGSRRLGRLRQELADEVGLRLSEAALEELAYAKYMKPHEGRRPAYGAVIPNGGAGHTSVDAMPPLPSAGGFMASSDDADVLRLFADGRTSFVLRNLSGRVAIAIDTDWRGSESALTEYAAANDVTVIQRLATGRIRIFLKDYVYSEEGGVWLTRPTAAAYRAKLAEMVDVEKQGIMNAILDLCLHTLSPAGNGATIVWFPDRSASPDGRLEPLEEDPYLDLSMAVSPPGLIAAARTHAAAIAHALGQMDRAVLLDRDGRLVQLNVTLKCSDEAAGLPFTGGTRHNSSGRYSASDERPLVFVVSADGPVTVFHRGEIAAALQAPLPPDTPT